MSFTEYQIFSVTKKQQLTCMKYTKAAVLNYVWQVINIKRYLPIWSFFTHLCKIDVEIQKKVFVYKVRKEK